MFLSKELVWDGKTYPMVDILPASIGVSKKPRGHGYTVIEVTAGNPYFEEGKILHGHEFHYSYLIGLEETDELSFVLTMKKGTGIIKGMDGICYKNVFATYTHLHALGATEWVSGLIKVACAYKEKNLSLN